MEVAEDKFWTAGVVFHSGTAPSFTQPFDFPLKHQSWGWEGFESLRKFWCWCLGRPSAFSCDPASLTHATGNSQSECSLQGSLATFTNMYFTFPWENYYRLKKKKKILSSVWSQGFWEPKGISRFKTGFPLNHVQSTQAFYIFSDWAPKSLVCFCCQHT